jgi:hypothetical protein
MQLCVYFRPNFPSRPSELMLYFSSQGDQRQRCWCKTVSPCLLRLYSSAPRHPTRPLTQLRTYRPRYAISIENRLAHVENAIENRLARVEDAVQRLMPVGQALESWMQNNDQKLLCANNSSALSHTFSHDL